jgi:diguanylate cyclase (GGDEF)-like protein/PAS domain S-box-containing protein
MTLVTYLAATDLVACAVCLFSAGLVLGQDYPSYVTRPFTVFCVLAAQLAGLEFRIADSSDASQALSLYSLEFAIWPLAAVLVLAFSRVANDALRPRTTAPSREVLIFIGAVLVGAAACVAAYFLPTELPTRMRWGWAFMVPPFYWASLVVWPWCTICLFMAMLRYRRTPGEAWGSLRRGQMRVLLLATITLLLTSSVTDGLFPSLSVPFPRLGALAAAAFSVIGCVALRSHGAFLLGPDSPALEILTSMDDGLLILDEADRIVASNPATTEMLGCRPQDITGQALADHVAMEPMTGLLAPRILEAGSTIKREITLKSLSGESIPATLSGFAVRGRDGSPQAVVAFLRDLRERKRAEATLRESERFIRAVVDSLHDQVLILEETGRVLSANKACEEASALSTSQPWPSVGQSFPDWLLACDSTGTGKVQEVADSIRAVLKGRLSSLSTEFPITRDGRASYFSLFAKRVSGTGPVRVVITFEDITERLQLLERLNALAYRDPLTGLANRRQFMHRLAEELSRARRSDHVLALLLIDLDRFKSVNDSLGHLAGDELLAKVGERLAGLIRQGDIIARLGGDEFTIIATDLQNPNDALPIASRVLKAFSVAYRLKGGYEIDILPSIGIAHFPLDGEDADSLTRYADIAMYRAKNRGGNTFQFYSSEMGEYSSVRMRLETGLRRALKRQEFKLHFQPQVWLQSGDIFGAEALLRWDDPEHGPVSPSEFIPIAEEMGMMQELGLWVLRNACRVLAGIHAAGNKDFRIAVNLAPQQIRQGDLAGVVESVLNEYALPPETLELELTESAALYNFDATLRILENIRDLGVRIALDDFGTGYSSLTYLKRFPVNTVKICGSFVKDISTSRDSRTIVEAVLRMGQSLGVELLLAEGIENLEQLAVLKEIGFMAGQGFMYARPMPVADLERLLAHTPAVRRRQPSTAK